jgi:hypothetical protein
MRCREQAGRQEGGCASAWISGASCLDDKASMHSYNVLNGTLT